VSFVERHRWLDKGKVTRMAIALEKVLRDPMVAFGQPEPKWMTSTGSRSSKRNSPKRIRASSRSTNGT